MITADLGNTAQLVNLLKMLCVSNETLISLDY